MLKGLEKIHNVGLMHRDVKPANIIFVNGHAKLGDMGLVANSRESDSLAGTPGFLPPELLQPSSSSRNTPQATFTPSARSSTAC